MVLIHQAFVCKADWRIGQTEVAEVWSSMNTMNWRYWAQPFHFFLAMLWHLNWSPWGELEDYHSDIGLLECLGTLVLQTWSLRFASNGVAADRSMPANACNITSRADRVARHGCCSSCLETWHTATSSAIWIHPAQMDRNSTLQFATVAFVNGCTDSPFLKMVHLLMENQKSLL